MRQRVCFNVCRAFLLFLLSVSAPGHASAAAPFDSAKLRQIEGEINQAIEEGKLPGGVLWLEHKDQRYYKAFGNRALVPEKEAMTEETVFDVASLTKVLATTPAIMLLMERGKVKLDEHVQTYIPMFKAGGKDTITLRHLLTHTSGLKPGLNRDTDWSGYEKAIALAGAEKVINQPGTTVFYSDINFITLGEVVRRVSGSPLEVFAAREIFKPLKMVDTRYLPPVSLRPRIAPTEKVDGEMLRGIVHDPSTRRMGGVAGHAGIFTTAQDMARFARMMLRGGELDGVRLLKPETVKLMTSVQTPEGILYRRGFGWDIDTGFSRPRGDVFPLGSYGHTGFTGTSIWIDPFSETFWIFLSNRVHPNGQGNILALQRELGTLCAEAVREFDFANVPGALKALPKEESSKPQPP